MNTYYLMSSDEMNDLIIKGDTLEQAIELAKQSSIQAYSFFNEYSSDNYYVETVKE